MDTFAHSTDSPKAPAVPGMAPDTVIVLASNSPRRRELLSMIVPEFRMAGKREVDENYPSTMEADEVPVFLSKVKAEAYAADLAPGEILLTADTVVICPDGEILGKPSGREEAIAMLSKLSGKTHRVVTGVTLSALRGCGESRSLRSRSFGECTRVSFAPLSEAEIETYVDTFRPFDKAGAYGIQEWIGCTAISGIDGCFYNVMGLPLHALYSALKDFTGND